MQSGLSIILGSVGRDGFPIPRMGHGCRVDALGKVRLTVGSRSAADLVQAVDDRQPIAATFTRPEDHRSIQIKAGLAHYLSVSRHVWTLSQSAICAPLERTWLDLPLMISREGERAISAFRGTFNRRFCARCLDAHELLALGGA